MWALVFAAVTVMLAAVAGTGEFAWGETTLEASINPSAESSPFRVKYQDYTIYEYGHGSLLHQHLGGKKWTLEGTASGSQDVLDLEDVLNRKLASDGSFARVSDLKVIYKFYLVPASHGSIIGYKVEVEGMLTGHVIATSERQHVVDLMWRGLTVTDDVTIDGVPINIPASLLRVMEPGAYELLAGTEADRILLIPLMDAEAILERSMSSWKEWPRTSTWAMGNSRQSDTRPGGNSFAF